MQKIIEQELKGGEDYANSQAKYTWGEKEIAYYYCTIFLDVFKVQFTGKRWLAGSKWGWWKVYQYQFLETSGKHDLSNKGYHNDGISHGKESEFYTTKQEAIDAGVGYLRRKLNGAVKDYTESIERLINYRDT